MIVTHEREDEETIYPRVSSYLNDGHGLSAMSRAHREILHQARLLGRLSDGLRPSEAEPYLIRDAQRIIETIDSLVHIHNAQEEDIYEHAAAQMDDGPSLVAISKQGAVDQDKAEKFDRALGRRRGDSWRWRIPVAILSVLVLGSGALYWRATRSTEVRVATHTTDHEPKTAEVVATGMIDALSATPVEARVSGVVQELYCDVGSKVSAGQTCARIDPHPFQRIVDRSKADAALSIARLEKSKARAAKALAAFEHARRHVREDTTTPKALEYLRKVAARVEAEVARDVSVG